MISHLLSLTAATIMATTSLAEGRQAEFPEIPSACSGEILWEQPPNGEDSITAMDDVCYPFYNRLADSFVGGNLPIGGVGWWGVYSAGPPRRIESFRIDFWDIGYEDCPGERLATYTVSDFHETVIDSEDPEEETYLASFCADLPEPFAAGAGIPYFVSITASLCFPPVWEWASGSGDRRHICYNDDWFCHQPWCRWYKNLDLAFVLFRDPFVPTEQSTWGQIKALYRLTD